MKDYGITYRPLREAEEKENFNTIIEGVIITIIGVLALIDVLFLVAWLASK